MVSRSLLSCLRRRRPRLLDSNSSRAAVSSRSFRRLAPPSNSSLVFLSSPSSLTFSSSNSVIN